jgi:predicted transcriptional regulator
MHVTVPAPPALHALESEVMEELWARSEATVREVQEALNARADKVRAYTTLLTVMTRLDGKGLLVRRRAGRLDVYSPALTRDAYLQARAESEVQALVEDFGDLALAHFARHVDGLDQDRLAKLRKLAGE